MREQNEGKEAREVKEHCGNVAAFFDLDGTLTALPSLERRFYRMLRYRREIPARNYLLWLREVVRLAPRGFSAILQANKMYLRGVQSFSERGGRDYEVSPWHKSGHQAEGQAPVPPRRNPRLPVPAFFAEAVERAGWHAKQGHAIVLLSGTLEPLAEEEVHALEAELAARGVAMTIRMRATRLEEVDGRWTGRIVGETMCGEAKARAARQMAADMELDLTKCYAYGDSANDGWLLETVGWPTAVNPSQALERIARIRGWPIKYWREGKTLTQWAPRTRSPEREEGPLAGGGEEGTQGQAVSEMQNEPRMSPVPMREAGSGSLG